MSRGWPLALAGTVVVLTSIAALIQVNGYIGAAIASVVVIFGSLGLARKLIERDMLTGTLSRSEMLRRVKSTLSRCGRSGGSIGAVSLDIERFGTINHLHGRLAGDAVLREVADRLVRSCPEKALVSRLHGDEFLVVLVGRSKEGVEEECSKLCACLRTALTTPVITAQAPIDVRVRIGAYIQGVRQDGGCHAEDLVMNSNIARRQQASHCLAIGTGYTPFNSELALASVRQAWIECEIPRAIQSGEVVLAYQPIVDVQSMRVVKCEALLRWTSSKQGVVGPDEFIPIAELSGQMEELGWFVIREVCRQIAAWREAGAPEMVVCVNVSPSQLRSPAFGEGVLRVLAKYAVPTRLFAIEITEGVIVDDDPVIRANLGVFAGAGVDVSLDDFGTGFSSLSRLASLSIQGLKIDKSFVSALRAGEDSRRDRRLVESICALADSMGVPVIAEGVDSEEKALELQSYGVRFMQGFLYSRAVPPEELAGVSRALLAREARAAKRFCAPAPARLQ